MGEMADAFVEQREYRKRLRQRFGVNCPQCNVVQPKRIPAILLPGQKCKVDGFQDPRPPLTRAQKESAQNNTTIFLKG